MLSAPSQTARRPCTSLPVNEWEAWLSKNRGPRVTYRLSFRPCAFCLLQIWASLPWQGKNLNTLSAGPLSETLHPTGCRTEHLYYTYSSLWSCVRQVCRRLRVCVHYSEQAADVSIAAEDLTRHCTGLNISFKDWRFIHRARLMWFLLIPAVVTACPLPSSPTYGSDSQSA